MLKPVLALAAIGAAGVVIWKVLLLPLLAGVLGFLLKVAVLVGIAVFVFWLIRKREDGKERGEAPAE